ncbi:MAG: amino acid ABC transporter substrate-binding protein [Ruminococcus sp.]|nr:amino acid ABC transporter substrate-binding protein [Ruminococcus sp.]MBQ9079047.1 amino acid ABC transporter substrate-binding protein [Ruminococcus sp.]
MKKSVFTRFLAAAAALSMLAVSAGCGGKDSSSESGSSSKEDNSLQEVIDSGKFVLGLDATFKPMGYTDENDEIVGFDIDVAEEVCERMGVDLVKQPINWDTKEEDLDAGRIDCIWNGMSVNPSRAEAMNLSDPYMKNAMVFVVPADSDAETMDDLANAAVGVQNGSTAQTILEGSEIGSSCSIQAMATNIEALQQMEFGLVDAVFLDSVVAEYEITSSGKDYVILPDGLEEEEYAIGFRKNDQKLRDEVQKILGEMKADGTLGKISTEWFGSDITTVK